MILRIRLVCGFRRFSERSRGLSTARPPLNRIPATATRGQSSPDHWTVLEPGREMWRPLPPEVSVQTEFFLVLIIISPALLQKFRKIDGFEQTRRRHIV